MENNKAFVATLGDIQKIDGADKIRKAFVMLDGVKIAPVVIGTDETEGQKVVYFDANMCLSETMLKQYPDLGRYLGRGGRVRAIKLRNTISNGLVVSVEKFGVWAGMAFFQEGVSFTHLGKVEICYKYTPPVVQVSTAQGNKRNKQLKKISRMIPGQFNFHVDTAQLWRNMKNISPNDVINVSRKLHGCVDGSTTVETLFHGVMTIKEIVDQRLPVHILAYDTEIKDNIYVPIDDYYFKEDDGDWFEIELENGKTLTITSNNPVWLPELGCYREVSLLQEGDALLLSD